MDQRTIEQCFEAIRQRQIDQFKANPDELDFLEKGDLIRMQRVSVTVGTLESEGSSDPAEILYREDDEWRVYNPDGGRNESFDEYLEGLEW